MDASMIQVARFRGNIFGMIALLNPNSPYFHSRAAILLRLFTQATGLFIGQHFPFSSKICFLDEL